MNPVLVPALAIAMCAIYTIVVFARRGRMIRGHQNKIRRWAARHGLQFSADDPFRLTEADFPLLRRGGKRKCSNVISGQWQGLPFAAAHYQFHENEADSRGTFRGYAHSYKYVAVVVANLDPRMQLPRTIIARRVVPTTLGDHIGLRPFFSGWEPFDRRFMVEGDGRVPPPVVNQPVMQHLLGSLASNTPAFRWEIAGSRLLVASFPRNQPTEDMLMEFIEPLLGEARSFAALINGPAR
jgi:hypothetical protein